MKNLKFRAWDKQLKHFKYFNLAICLPCFADESNFVVQQWTGLFDKNQKEIYEGDILRYPINKCIDDKRQFKKDEFEFNNLEFKFKNEDNSLWLVIMDGEPEIVGNIFENENLLI